MSVSFSPTKLLRNSPIEQTLVIPWNTFISVMGLVDASGIA